MTQYEKIFSLMVRRHGVQEWFFPYDFMQSTLGDLFVGYEASARISEMCKKYPDLIEWKHEGKYRLIRLKFEQLPDALKALPFETKQVLLRELSEKGIINVIKV